MRGIRGYVVAWLAAGCGGNVSTSPPALDGGDDAGPTANVQGSVAGLPIPHPSVTAISATGSGPDATYVVVYVSSQPLTCADWAAPRMGQTRLDIYLFSPTGAALSPGTYPQYVGTGHATQPFAAAFLHSYDPTCSDRAPSMDFGSKSGALTLTELGPRIGGSFDFTFVDGRFTGTFEVPACSAPAGDSGAGGGVGPDGGVVCL